MATHSSILAWKIPQTKEPGGLQSTWLETAGHDWACVHAGQNCPVMDKSIPQACGSTDAAHSLGTARLNNTPKTDLPRGSRAAYSPGMHSPGLINN